MSTARKVELAPDEIKIQEALKDGTARIVEHMSMKELGRPDVEFQSRVKHLDMDHVHRLSMIHDREEKLSPIVVFHAVKGAKQKWIVSDGFHRHEVYRRKGLPSIRAYVFEASWGQIEHEARLFSAMSNQVTMLARTPDDARKAVEMLLADPVTTIWSDARIAKHCGVGNSTAGRYRREYHLRNGIALPELVIATGGEGRLYETARTTGLPTISSNGPGKGYKATIGGKFHYLGLTEESARAKLEEILSDRRSRLKRLEHYIFRRWLLNRGVLSESFVGDERIPRGLKCFSVPGAIVTTSAVVDPPSVALAMGSLLLMATLSVRTADRMVCACYPEDGHSECVKAARERGFEFLTPEELVASLTS